MKYKFSIDEKVLLYLSPIYRKFRSLDQYSGRKRTEIISRINADRNAPNTFEVFKKYKLKPRIIIEEKGISLWPKRVVGIGKYKTVKRNIRKIMKLNKLDFFYELALSKSP